MVGEVSFCTDMTEKKAKTAESYKRCGNSEGGVVIFWGGTIREGLWRS